jgi:hypothetical protein
MYLGCIYDDEGTKEGEDVTVHKCYDLKDECTLYTVERGCALAPQSMYKEMKRLII